MSTSINFIFHQQNIELRYSVDTCDSWPTS